MFPLWLLLACSDKQEANTFPQSNQNVSDTVDTDETSHDDTGIHQTDTAQVDTALPDTGDDTNPDTGPSDVNMVKDFTLPDINPLSSSYNQSYSPRDFLQAVSGWYFIKGT